MRSRQGIFLTGATGLVGQYLLRELLISGHAVAALIRSTESEPASQRLARLLAWTEESAGRRLPRPILLEGNLHGPDLGLDATDRRWLARNARSVIHSAAHVAFQTTAEGEPWRTNVEGTSRLLELCRDLGLAEVHHLSTAYVCGDRSGVVYEDELDCGNGSSSAYEQSKLAAEQVVQSFPGIRPTIYRPSVIVGDSRTGYTSSYHHFYRFLELSVRLAGRSEGSHSSTRPQRQRLALRLPLSGEETQNLVPVDWVARAIVALVQQPGTHGRTYHLVARQSVRLCEVVSLVQDLLHLEGIEWTGGDGLSDPTAVEQMVLEQFHDYWPYLRSSLTFDFRNTAEALPDLKPPAFDRGQLVQLLDFARQDGWGRKRKAVSVPRGTIAHYLECVLPGQMKQSSLPRILPRDLSFAIDVRGPGGGVWSCRWADRSLCVQPGVPSSVPITYRMESSTFADVVEGRQTPREAFFEGRVSIAGDTEKALKLAVFIEQLVAESRTNPSPRREAAHASF